MQPRIETLQEKKLIGKHLNMSLADNKTHELWHSFMPLRKEIKNTVSADLYSMQVYDPSLNFKDFTFTTVFKKWAAIEVTNFNEMPSSMDTFILPGGLYAVFIYRGLPSDFGATFHYIFNIWLPQSEFIVDNRPHFELLGEKYKNEDPASEEEVWIPIKSKVLT